LLGIVDGRLDLANDPLHGCIQLASAGAVGVHQRRVLWKQLDANDTGDNWDPLRNVRAQYVVVR
jgi:hypothetical protein